MIIDCHQCHKTDEEARLRKCPICHKHYCEDHCYEMSGMTFCSQGCGEYFFYGDPDE
jgi:hypothetical protein